MLSVSNSYKKAIKADTELAWPDAEFGFVPPGATEGSSVTVSLQAEQLSYPVQVNNKVYNMSDFWATGEINRIVLDGTRKMPDRPPNLDQEIGFLSRAFSGANGVFNQIPSITYTLDRPYDLIGTQVYFDEPCNEYAFKLTVTFKSGAATLLSGTYSNDGPVFTLDAPLNNVTSIVITITAWNLPYRMAKVPTVIPGQIRYLKDKLISAHLIERIAPFDSAMSFPQVKLTFDNQDRAFDIVNPTGLVAFLRQRMYIESVISIATGDGKSESVSIGSFLLYSWPDNSEDETATFICAPSMAFLNGYYENTGRGQQTIAQAAALIFSDEEYYIPAKLSVVMVNQYIGDNVPLRDAMGQLAVAAGGYFKCERDGSYTLIEWTKGVQSASDTLTYDEIWERPGIRQSPKVSKVNVKYYVWNATQKQLVEHSHIRSLDPDDGELKEVTSMFISSSMSAEQVADKALDYYGRRLSYDVKYRGDMSLEQGDTLSVETDYGNSAVLITENIISFGNTHLDGSAKGVGI